MYDITLQNGTMKIYGMCPSCNCHWIMFIHEFDRPETPQELHDL